MARCTYVPQDLTIIKDRVNEPWVFFLLSGIFCDITLCLLSNAYRQTNAKEQGQAPF